MSFNRELLPKPLSYFENQGLTLKGSSNWRTTECRFHGGSDSMRINIQSGGWICMSCGVKGGDVLAYQMQAYEQEFVLAAKSLNALIDDGQSAVYKTFKISPREALEVLAFEATIVAVAAGNIAQGVCLTDKDRSRLMTCTSRINMIVEGFV